MPIRNSPNAAVGSVITKHPIAAAMILMPPPPKSFPFAGHVISENRQSGGTADTSNKPVPISTKTGLADPG